MTISYKATPYRLTSLLRQKMSKNKCKNKPIIVFRGNPRILIIHHHSDIDDICFALSVHIILKLCMKVMGI